MIILKNTKKESFTFSLESTFFEKPPLKFMNLKWEVSIRLKKGITDISIP